MSLPFERPDNCVAIVGMAGRFPGAADIDAFWRNICGGVESIQRLTPAELEARGVPPELLADPTFVPVSALPPDYDRFDAAFFGYTARQAELMDPQHRLFLECAWTALENAGYDAERYPGAIGVFGGATLNTYLYAGLLADPRTAAAVDPLELNIANGPDFLTTRVSYKLNLTGPSHVVQCACSTSLVAVHIACQSLLQEECDLALAGGASINVTMRDGYRYLSGGMTSPDGRCCAFDAAARGTVFGGGAAIVVLKRLTEAIADRDTIVAVVRGSAVNNDGSFKVGYTAPSLEGQARVIAEALANAGVEPSDIGYVEAHGTGTPLGDPIEVQALTRVMDGAARMHRCALGSVKTNVGHLDAAAGAAGLVKAALMLRHKLLVPSLNFSQPNPEIDFAAGPFRVSTALCAWPVTDAPRRAGVSAFGVGGTNAHVVLEEPPAERTPAAARPAELLVWSAPQPQALDTTAANLAGALAVEGEHRLADVAYTLAVGRKAFKHRRAIVVSSGQAVSALSGDAPAWIAGEARDREPEVVFLFQGQGSQRPGMGAGFYRNEPAFREALDRCSSILEPHLGLELRSVLYGADASKIDVKETWIGQPILFSFQYSVAQLWLSWGVRPALLLGHSLGEYVAACVAGVLSLEDALRLVATRARLMHGMERGVMLSVPLAEDELAVFLSPRVDLAAVNTPMQCVLSGTSDAIAALEQRFAREAIVTGRLATSHAFHSAMMEPMLDRFEALVRSVEMRAPSIPYVSNVSGNLAGDEVRDAAYWVQHLRRTVRFADGVRTALAGAPRLLIEMGGGESLTTFVRQNPACTPDTRLVPCIPRGTTDDYRALIAAAGQAWVHGVPIDWARFYRDEPRGRVPVPTYPFERQRYWIEPRRSTAAAIVTTPMWQQQVTRVGPKPSATRSVCVIVGAESPLAVALEVALKRRRVATVVASPASDFRQLAGDRYEVRVSVTEDYRRVLDAAGTPDAPVTHVVSVADGAQGAESVLAAHALATAMTASTHAARASLVLAATDAAAVTPDEEIGSTAWAACFESAGDRFGAVPLRCVDVRCRGVETAAERLADEVLRQSATPTTALREGTRWQRLAADVEAPDTEAPDADATAEATEAKPAPGRVIITGAWTALELEVWRTWAASSREQTGIEAAAVSIRDELDTLRAAIASEGNGGSAILYIGDHKALAEPPTPAALDAAATKTQARLEALARIASACGVRACALIPAAASDTDPVRQLLEQGLFASFAHRQNRVGPCRWSHVTWRLPRGAAGGWALRGVQQALSRFLRVMDTVAGPVTLAADSTAPALEASHARPELSTAYVTPASDAEQRIARVWSSVLGIADIGATDHFFELGGDSLSALQAAARLQQELGCEVPVTLLYEGLTPRGLSKLLDAPVRPARDASERRAQSRRQFQERVRLAR